MIPLVQKTTLLYPPIGCLGTTGARKQHLSSERREYHKTPHHKYQDDSAEVDVEALDIYNMFFVVVSCIRSTDVLWMKFKYLLTEDATQ
ncbi:hypothetical protein PHYPO_G00002680 [Pangasianodon hypophthalmus]|uniref:Uncharacterized protein n=1 Tax=Pangasianodon hypophthalmus TaxID=310915 RepID=A0A5N5Q5K7_PANHP|nr:hypothetical protein PHYPO_G00002680 [Pangasianodon hypophthalmus]